MDQNLEGLSFKRNNLRADCGSCYGLCCVALYYSAAEGFPADKKAGEPCPNLLPDFRCSVYPDLRELGFKGCTAFDCLGAGQKVSQVHFRGEDWRKAPQSAQKIFGTFQIIRQLNELLWYLTEALTFQAAYPIHESLKSMLEKTEQFTFLDQDSLLKLDAAEHRKDVDTLLQKTSKYVRAEVQCGPQTSLRPQRMLGKRPDLIGSDLRTIDLRGKDLRGAYLIAADLRGADLTGTDLIGADLRDTDLRGADLTASLFLTQGQINQALGDKRTSLPSALSRPKHWEISSGHYVPD